jgi:4-amino-4-deoxy-L-arabinose transferase-like glycosyltransferase
MSWRDAAVIVGVAVVFLFNLPWATLISWAKEETKSNKEVL